MKTEDFKQIKELLSSKKNIVIVSHRNPDGDAYGSSLALFHFFKKLNHEVTVVSPNDCPDFLKWLPGQKEIVLFEGNETKASKILNETDIVFTLDFNAFHRTGDRMGTFLETIQPIFIMIDHHLQPDDYAKYRYSDPKKCSTCEMIYDFIENLDLINHLDKDIATCLYTGIMTDTGSFRFPLTTARTHMIIAELINNGANNNSIYNSVHHNSNQNKLKLLSKALFNLRVMQQYKTAFISLSKEELNRFHYQKGDTEGFVDYALAIKGVVFAVIFIEDNVQNIIKMSFRSKGTFSVNEFARKHFNGGGHANAAGGRSEVSLEETINKFIKILPEFKTEIDNSYEK